jgi:tRNA(Arg) A34 adenosine deaminase TadA
MNVQADNNDEIKPRRRFLKGAGVLAAAAVLVPQARAESGKVLKVNLNMPNSMLEGSAQGFPSQGLEPTHQQSVDFLRAANNVGKRSMALGHHPFGAVLVGPDQHTILLTQGNQGSVLHAEATLARMAAGNYTPEFLWGCTLYTSVEPCCMCAGTIYWANIGRVVYGMTEEQLLELTGDNKENPTMSIPSRYVFAHGQKAVKVLGPVPEIMTEIVDLQRQFWNRS